MPKIKNRLQNQPITPRLSLSLIRLLKVAWRTRKLAGHDKWTREQINAHQEKELRVLRDFAYNHSPFYKKFHQGLENSPLSSLPVLTKKELMKSWDDIVTDRSLHLKDIEHFLNNLKSLEPYQNKYFIFATGGTTGVKGIIPFSKEEFFNFFPLSIRASSWSGVHFGFGKLPRTAIVQSRLPWHVAGVATFVKIPFLKTLPLDTVESLQHQVQKLNAFQPHIIGGYASNIHLLALEQISGRLKISPKMVFSTAETLKKEARKAIEKAWGRQPFEAYASTETAELATECLEHKGMHIYEDMAIVEVVDNNNQPVAPGKYGSKVLVTIFWHRTMPLIRYELSDHVKLATAPCPCGREFQLIEAIQGREEDTIYLSGQSGNKVRIEPDIFFDNMVLLPIDGWQIVQKSKDALKILILGPHPEFNENNLIQHMMGEMKKCGAKSPKISVEYIRELQRTKIGKLKTIQALKSKGLLFKK